MRCVKLSSFPWWLLAKIHTFVEKVLSRLYPDKGSRFARGSAVFCHLLGGSIVGGDPCSVPMNLTWLVVDVFGLLLLALGTADGGRKGSRMLGSIDTISELGSPVSWVSQRCVE